MTQGELEKLALKTGNLFAELEIRIMSDIARRIRDNGFATASVDWQMTRLQQLGMAESEIKGWIKETLQKTDAEMEYIFSDEVYKQYYQHARAYKVSGMQQIPFEQNTPLKQLTRAVKKQLSGEYENLSASMGFAIRGPDGRIQYSPLMEFYRSTLDNAVLDIQSGAFSYETVLQRAVSRMTASGVRWVDYDSGVHNRIDVAARRAVLTGFRQVQALINEQTAADLGTDSYEVSYHVGARPSHQPWEGRVWTKEELVSVCGLGDVTGLCGANCYHDYLPFIPGVSVRTYTDEQLQEMIVEENTPKEYYGKQYTTYEALQEQRRREREIRATRQQITLLQEGGADEKAIILKKARYQGQLQNYVDFSQKMGLPEQKARITQDGLRGRFTPTKAEAVRTERSSGQGQSGSVQYMSNSFRPHYGKEGQISTGVKNITVYTVENSEFDIVADTNNPKSKAVRLTEKNLRRVQTYLPGGFKLPKIAVVDFENNRLSPNAIGGYSESMGIMYMNSKYDTNEKIVQFVNRASGRFANTTELAPYLHELGHKYYYDCVKSLAKQRQISYTEAQKIVDYGVYRYIESQNDDEFLRKNISEYANTQKMTEVCAESFSVMNSNEIAKKIIEIVGRRDKQ